MGEAVRIKAFLTSSCGWESFTYVNSRACSQDPYKSRGSGDATDCRSPTIPRLRVSLLHIVVSPQRTPLLHTIHMKMPLVCGTARPGEAVFPPRAAHWSLVGPEVLGVGPPRRYCNPLILCLTVGR